MIGIRHVTTVKILDTGVDLGFVHPIIFLQSGNFVTKALLDKRQDFYLQLASASLTAVEKTCQLAHYSYACSCFDTFQTNWLRSLW